SVTRDATTPAAPHPRPNHSANVLRSRTSLDIAATDPTPARCYDRNPCLPLLRHATAFAQQWGRPQVPASGACFYEDINFGGSYFCATAGMASPQITYRMNNRISSIRLFGSAEVTVYQEYNFTGRSRTIGSDLDDLRRGGWNDR